MSFISEISILVVVLCLTLCSTWPLFHKLYFAIQ